MKKIQTVEVLELILPKLIQEQGVPEILFLLGKAVEASTLDPTERSRLMLILAEAITLTEMVEAAQFISQGHNNLN